MARIANPSVFRAETVMIDWNAVANAQREAGGQVGDAPPRTRVSWACHGSLGVPHGVFTVWYRRPKAVKLVPSRNPVQSYGSAVAADLDRHRRPGDRAGHGVRSGTARHGQRCAGAPRRRSRWSPPTSRTGSGAISIDLRTSGATCALVDNLTSPVVSVQSAGGHRQRSRLDAVRAGRPARRRSARRLRRGQAGHAHRADRPDQRRAGPVVPRGSAVRLVPGAALRGDGPRLADARPAADGRRAAGRAAPPPGRPVHGRACPNATSARSPVRRSCPDRARRRSASARRPRSTPHPGRCSRSPRRPTPTSTSPWASAPRTRRCRPTSSWHRSHPRVPGHRHLLRRTGDRRGRSDHRRRPGRRVRRLRAAGAARGDGVAARPDLGPLLAERTGRHGRAVAGERPAVLAAPDRRRGLGTSHRAGVLPLPDRRRACRAGLREERATGAAGGSGRCRAPTPRAARR